MGGGDDEFEDFLRRRTPTFRRAPDDTLEPPPELDRIVLRQAREAIEAERPQRVYQGAGWGAPLALAATLLLAFTIVLQVVMPKKAPVPEVTVQTVAQRLDYPAAAPAAAVPEPMAVKREVASPAPERRRAVMAEARLNTNAPVLVSQEEADRYAPAPPPAPSATGMRTNARTTQSAVAKASSTPEWRRDSKTWLAEIDRLRAEGRSAEADAEMAEFKREHRAYAVAPDK